MARAPSVFPVPAGPRKRKLRMGSALPVDCLACLQMVTTSSGSTYQGARTGTRLCSKGVSTRVVSSTYFPTKSL